MSLQNFFIVLYMKIPTVLKIVSIWMFQKVSFFVTIFNVIKGNVKLKRNEK